MARRHMAATSMAPASKGGASPGHPCWLPSLNNAGAVVDDARTAPAATITATLTLVFPCYNEAGRLPRTLGTYLGRLPQMLGQVEVIVVDDGSTDGTAALARTVAAGDQRVRVIGCERNRGKGFAVRTGMLAAEGELVVFTDADGSYQPDDVERIVAALADAPVAIGSRDLNIQASSPTRQLASMLFNRAMRTMLDLPFRDTQCGLKGFRRQAALEVFGRARLDGFAFDAEVLYLARHLGLRVAEVAVQADERDGSKVRVAVDALTMLKEALAAPTTATRASTWPHGFDPLPQSPSRAIGRLGRDARRPERETTRVQISVAPPALSQGSPTLRRMQPSQDRQDNGSGDGAGQSLGYARVSTAEQHIDLQLDALQHAGCYRIFTDKASGAAGALAARPELDRILDQLRPGDTLVVWKLR
jgi:hypothetical protein